MGMANFMVGPTFEILWVVGVGPTDPPTWVWAHMYNPDSKIERFIDLLENFAVELVSRSGNDLVPIFTGCGISGSEIFF